MIVFSFFALSTQGYTAVPWEPDYQKIDKATAHGSRIMAEAIFLQAVNDFIIHEGVDFDTVEIELAPLNEAAGVTTGHWRALAQVFVDETPGGYEKRLVLEPAYWLNPTQAARFTHHRLAKLLWHELHHIRYLPENLRRATELAAAYPPTSAEDFLTWRRQWISFLEPLEELAAERTSIERYELAFGPLTGDLLTDSRADMLKHAARYNLLLADLLKKVRDPNEIRRLFPAQLPIFPDGTISRSSSH